MPEKCRRWSAGLFFGSPPPGKFSAPEPFRYLRFNAHNLNIMASLLVDTVQLTALVFSLDYGVTAAGAARLRWAPELHDGARQRGRGGFGMPSFLTGLVFNGPASNYVLLSMVPFDVKFGLAMGCFVVWYLVSSAAPILEDVIRSSQWPAGRVSGACAGHWPVPPRN